MTEFELLIDLHKSGERQGPGSVEDTLKALGMIDLPLHEPLKIADIGCGSGGQTLTLARNTNAHLTAVDLSAGLLDELKARSETAGLSDRITTLQCSMSDLPFSPGEFDIIWSEGAIYNMGFEAGIRAWKRLLRTGGYLAVSEVTWISHNRPKVIQDYWLREYPEIDIASNKIRILEDNGYTLAGYFYLRPSSWLENYYLPLEARFSSFLENHNHSAPARKIVEEHKEETKMYERFKDHYSYGFYIARSDS